MCAAIDMSVADLVRMSAGTREAQTFSLSLEQERTLASDASLLALFYLLLNGRSVEAAERRLGLNPRVMRALLVRLVEAQLIDIDAKRRVHLHARLPIAWRPDGPVRKLYERQVRAEFLQGPFTGSERSAVVSFGRAVAGVGAHPARRRSTSSRRISPTSRRSTCNCRRATRPASRCCWRAGRGCSRCSRRIAPKL